jgi:Anti-sigma-K factor rskA
LRKLLDELIGSPDDLDAVERERLRRVHELLLDVPAPPDVPRQLQTPAALRRRPERRRPAQALLAAALALLAFGAGFVAGDRRGDPEAVRTIAMSGVGDGLGAAATIELLPEDDAGNWPMDVHVDGLEPNARGGDWYELWLTKDGRPIASCGRFTVAADEVTVHLSVPYRLRGYDGWIVTRRGSDAALLTTPA